MYRHIGNQPGQASATWFLNGPQWQTKRVFASHKLSAFRGVAEESTASSTCSSTRFWDMVGHIPGQMHDSLYTFNLFWAVVPVVHATKSISCVMQVFPEAKIWLQKLKVRSNGLANSCKWICSARAWDSLRCCLNFVCSRECDRSDLVWNRLAPEDLPRKAPPAKRSMAFREVTWSACSQHRGHTWINLDPV